MSAGSYTVTITDANSCTQSKSVTLTQPLSLISNLTSTEPLCKNGANGTISLTVTGGVNPYSYSWNNGSTNSMLFNLLAGNYTVTVTDATNCTTESTVNLNDPLNGINYTFTKQDVDCYGNATGYIILTAMGGNAPYSYKWNNSKTSSGIANLKSGTYNFTITDAMNCPVNDSIEISQPDEIIVDFAASDSEIIIQDSILFSNFSTGGTIYQWYFGDGDGSTVFSPEKTYNVVGLYSVTLTVMNNTGCSNSLVKKDYIKVQPLIITSIDNNNIIESKIYPNPSNDFIFIDLPESFSNNIEFTILDKLGRTNAFKPTLTGINGKHLKINISDLSSGDYILRIRLNDKNYYYHFVAMGNH